MKNRKNMILLLVSALTIFILIGCNTQQPASQAPAPAPTTSQTTTAAGPSTTDIFNVLPKFAIPMREVGDRFDNMYFAAKNGNWALAAYMSKYMNAAMNPAKLTKPDEYKIWSSYYTGTFDSVNKAISAKDFSAFDKAYSSGLDGCNGCHNSTGYKFIKIIKATEPADKHEDYSVKSEPGDVPK
jgi:hypothetical protein